MEHGTVHNLPQILLVALCEEEQGFCVAVGGVEQALAVGILANAFEYRPHGAGQLGQSLVLLLFRRFLSLTSALAFGTLAVHATGVDERTRPAQPVKIDRRLLRVRTLRAACSQRSLRHSSMLIVSFHVDLAVDHVVAVSTICICARCPLGEIAIRHAFEVDGLAAAA